MRMQLALPGNLTIDTLSYQISGPAAFSGTINVADAVAIGFALPNVAPGSGYVLTESAVSIDGAITCSGTSAPFAVAAGSTTQVNVNLACTVSPEAGSILDTTVAAECATWNSAFATPSVAPVSGSVQLSASARAPDASALTYTWSAAAGSIDAPNAANANFTCPATAGDVTLTLVVGDGPLPSGASCPVAETTTTITVSCVAVDSGTPDAGPPPPPVPCTAAGQTGCIPCSGNASGLCSATQALLIQHDIAAGHATTTDCYSCLLNAGCIDDTQFSDTGHECDDLAGSFGGASSSSLCLSTLGCVLGSSCASSDISVCYCGAGNAGTACQTAASPNGACFTAEVTGLGVSDNASVLKDLTDTTRPSGMANQIFACAESYGCAACLQ
ncbi:MAG TPA: hypothetical protein VGI39_02975 [Polyangiaceae bacterium]